MSIDPPVHSGCITNSTFGLATNTQSFTSPLTKNSQRALLGGARWEMTITLRKMLKAEPAAADWIAFFLKCDGSVNPFNAYDVDRKAPRGTPTGTPLVKGAGQTGTSLNIDGCTANVKGWLKTGDYFAWTTGELKQLIQDADTDGSGNATLTFRPAIRTSPADNTSIIVTQPTCTMVLADDMQAKWECDKNGVYQEKTFTAYEVFS